LDAFVVTLREGFEASLIVGLVMAYLVKTGQDRQYARPVWWGVSAAAAFSALIGLILFLAVGELEGSAEALYEATAMVLAAGVLTWMVFWMRKQARTIGGQLRAQVQDAIRAGSAFALASVAFIGVAREGIETALFLFAATNESQPIVTVTGGVLGLACAVVLGALFYRGAIKINLRTFFAVTGTLVIALAAYLLFNGLHEFGEGGAGEAIEESGPFVAVAYGATFLWLFLRGLRGGPAEAKPQEASEPAAP
jgi:high-affinity iron transporter